MSEKTAQIAKEPHEGEMLDELIKSSPYTKRQLCRIMDKSHNYLYYTLKKPKLHRDDIDRIGGALNINLYERLNLEHPFMDLVAEPRSEYNSSSKLTRVVIDFEGAKIKRIKYNNQILSDQEHIDRISIVESKLDQLLSKIG